MPHPWLSLWESCRRRRLRGRGLQWQKRAKCGTITVVLFCEKGSFRCSCLNWSAPSFSARWRGPTGLIMRSCCFCCGRSAATRRITASPGRKPSPGRRITLPPWQSRWRWMPMGRGMRTSSLPGTRICWRWAFCSASAAPAGWKSSPAAMRKSPPSPLCPR